MPSRIAIYPISANPPTWGHADILHRAAQHFDHLYWAAAINSQKQYLFTPEDRVRMMQTYVDHYHLTNVTVESYTGATVRYAEGKQARVLVKGLRNFEDFQGEFQQASGNRGINGIETFCMFTNPQFCAVSSSLVRELAWLGEDIEAYVLESVAVMIQRIVSERKKSLLVE